MPATVCRTVKVQFTQDVTFVMDSRLPDPHSRIIAETGAPFMEAPSAMMIRLLRPGQTVIDLGGHIGTYALLAGALGCRVAVVEASPVNAALIRESARRSGFDHVRVFNAAVGDRRGKLHFGPYGPWGHVKKTSAPEELALIEVPAITVDELVVGLGWGRVDFVKMDVEGYEPLAIRGMTELLSRSDSPPILYESNAHGLSFYGHTTAQLLGAIEGFGYVNYLVDWRRPGKLVPVRSTDVQEDNVVDYLAVKNRPGDLSGFLLPPLTREELKARLLDSCASASASSRWHQATALQNGPAWVLFDPDIRAALRRLRRDPDPFVAKAAAWVARLPELGIPEGRLAA